MCGCRLCSMMSELVLFVRGLPYLSLYIAKESLLDFIFAEPYHPRSRVEHKVVRLSPDDVGA